MENLDVVLKTSDNKEIKINPTNVTFEQAYDTVEVCGGKLTSGGYYPFHTFNTAPTLTATLDIDRTEWSKILGEEYKTTISPMPLPDVNKRLRNAFKKFVEHMYEIGVDPFSSLIDDEKDADKLGKFIKKSGNLVDGLIDFYVSKYGE